MEVPTKDREMLLGFAMSFTQTDIHQINKRSYNLTDISMRQVRLMFNRSATEHPRYECTPRLEKEILVVIEHY